jgi:tetratricopeptide (TPR) repeat protein
MPVPTVFISYSHRDESWKNKLLPQLHALEQAGIGMRVWHDRKIDGGDLWYPEIQEAMANAAVSLLLISPDFLASAFISKEEVPYLIARQEKHGMLLIPVLVRSCVWEAHRWLASRQMIPRDGKCVAIDFPGDQADIVFRDLAKAIYLHFAQLADEPQIAPSIPAGVQQLAHAEIAKIPAKPFEPPPAPKWSPLDPSRVDLNHLPATGAALFGRDETLTFLDQAWGSQASAVRVLAFTAQGGVGKSTLINHWLAEMRRDHFRGATRVFGWSFYSQGVQEQGAPSAGAFVAAALKFFGDETMAASAASPWEKGLRLARLVGAERALLVLDGMEPLQSAHLVDRGKLRDLALEALLPGLAKKSAGLCLITTREPLAELGKKSGVVECDLDQITPQAGRALLRALHIVGTDSELESLAARFGPHALAISLLGVYLHEQPGCRIGPATALEQMPGETPVDRVLAGFEEWLGPSAELEALRLLGFFDRPADEGCLQALRAKPAIPGLTELLANMTDADWPRILARLTELRIIQVRRGDRGSRFVDTHPIIREHFAKQLRERSPDTWREGHRRQYVKFGADAVPDPKSLEDLMPYYRAIAHGCQAGLYTEALIKIYHRVIQRGQLGFAQKVLGASGEDLAALSWFFHQPWTEVIPSIDAEWQAWLPGNAASRLRAMTRIRDAVGPALKSVEEARKKGLTMLEAIRKRQFSELQLILGETKKALKYAKEAVSLADRAPFLPNSAKSKRRKEFEYCERIIERAVRAGALHAAGYLDRAKAVFEEAEELQRMKFPKHPLLYSLWGFRYCDLLLHQGDRADVLRRIDKTATWAKLDPPLPMSLGLLDVPLDDLSLIRCHLSQFDQGNVIDLDPVERLTEEAITLLRESGKHDFLPLGFLVRVAVLQRQIARCSGTTDAFKRVSKLDEAQRCLDDAWEIAERGPMKLFMADIHLHRARLFFRETTYPWNQHPNGTPRGPKDDLAAARKLIEKCGYWRRKEELKDAEAALNSA